MCCYFKHTVIWSVAPSLLQVSPASVSPIRWVSCRALGWRSSSCVWLSARWSARTSWCLQRITSWMLNRPNQQVFWSSTKPYYSWCAGTDPWGWREKSLSLWKPSLSPTQVKILQGLFKGIAHLKRKFCLKSTHPQGIQDVDKFVSSWEQIWSNLALHHLLTSGSSAVNGCHQDESPNTTPVH